MKHKPLRFCAGFFHGIETLSCAPIVLSALACPILILVALATGLWKAPVLALGLCGASFSIWSMSQCVSSAACFLLHRRIGTRATLGPDGLSLEGELLRNPRFVEWCEIVSVNRFYARFFELYEIRFRDEPAYQLTLISGESVWADFVDQAALQDECEARGISADGFDERLMAG